MSLSYNVNTTPATGSVAMYNLKTLLKDQGWTVPRSSDGSTYSSSADLITTGAAGAGGMANSSAWFIIKQPVSAGTRAFCIQRGTTNLVWRVKYGFGGSFTGGAPDATTTPTSTDEQIVTGAGSDAVPTFGALFTTDGTYRHHMMADSDCTRFWSICYATGGGNPAGVHFLDALSAGTYPAEDVDPVVMHFYAQADDISSATPVVCSTGALNTGRIYGFIAKGLAGEGFVAIPPMAYFTGNGSVYAAPLYLGQNPHNSKEDLLPMIYGRSTTATSPTGYKGVSSLFKWIGHLRTTADALTVSTASDRIVFGNMVANWNGSVPLV